MTVFPALAFLCLTWGPACEAANVNPYHPQFVSRPVARWQVHALDAQIAKCEETMRVLGGWDAERRRDYLFARQYEASVWYLVVELGHFDEDCRAEAERTLRRILGDRAFEAGLVPWPP